jgi:hypothetical protein
MNGNEHRKKMLPIILEPAMDSLISRLAEGEVLGSIRDVKSLLNQHVKLMLIASIN